VTPDPPIWYQKRPGGPWYQIGHRERVAHYIKVCEGCGQEFLGARKQQRFCSMNCANKALRQVDNPDYLAGLRPNPTRRVAVG